MSRPPSCVALLAGGSVAALGSMTSLDSGAGFGLTVMPEIGDEVLVGFLDSDPERPVVLGSLWNELHKPPRDQFATANESAES